MNAQIRGWKDEFDVESPNQLRGTIAGQVLDVTEADRRRDIARRALVARLLRYVPIERTGSGT
jgi:hypothetical protein